MKKRHKNHEVLGKYAGTDSGIRPMKTPKDNAPGTDWSKIVFEDSPSTHNAGSGKLSNPGTRNK